MTVSLRRLAGLTSLASNWRRSQRVSIGPSGAAAVGIGSPSFQRVHDQLTNPVMTANGTDR